MHVLVTGGTGYVGRFVVEAARAAGHRVTLLGRRPAPDTLPWSLADTRPRLPPADALVHAALDHAPGAYRGGEGDPARFRRLNLDGTRALFDAAPVRIVFISSRAVYGDRRRGETLRECDPPSPDSLYGETKLAAEQALAERGVSLRATGVYGGAPHKWQDLFAAYLRGDPVPPRLATEVHGADLAAAVLLGLDAPPGVLNVSDLLLDRHDLLARVQALTACPHPPPPRFPGPAPGIMATDRLRALGWHPGGVPRLDAFLAEALAHTTAG
jgi:nucleoside-diphosphate-sugar epimerase